MRRNAKRRTVRWIVVLLLIAVVTVLAVYNWPGGGNANDANAAPNTPAGGPDANAPAAGTGDRAAGDSADTDTDPATGPAAANGKVRRLRRMQASAARKAAEAGEALLAENKLAEGRAELTRALLSGALPPATAKAVRGKLVELAERMLLSPRVVDGDPYTFQYTFRPGDVLVRVERALQLRVPAQILLKINNIADARGIRAGQTLKMIRGPFHAIVDKSDFTMDVYLLREGLPPAYVKRFGVGLGKNGSTPTGLWRVGFGRKMVRAPWNPPPNAEQTRKILWGQPDYPLGKMGYWIGLEGIDDNTRLHTGYGIHGTDEPESIGRAESLGCIRLADEDIEQVFAMLYESGRDLDATRSTVRVRP